MCFLGEIVFDCLFGWLVGALAAVTIGSAVGLVAFPGSLLKNPCWLQELATLYNSIFDMMVADVPDAETDVKPRLADAILKFAYVWYTFMPLARGSAVVGYIAILALFAAAGMPVTSHIPQVQHPSASVVRACVRMFL